MRKVVHSNMLSDKRLADYWRRSLRNFAVLADYASMEVYKTNSGRMS